VHRSPALLALAVSTVLLAGCGGGNSASSEPAGASRTAPLPGGPAADRDAYACAEAPPGEATAGQAGPNAATAPDTSKPAADVAGRVGPATSVIRTGELTVVVENVPMAADEAGRILRAAGGNVEAEERGDSDRSESAVLRLRVPPEAFDTTIAALSGLGEERNRRLGNNDVTEQVIDLDSRLSTQRASVERVRALLAEAEDLREVVAIEAELTRRIADLESLEARLTALTGQVDLATISLRLTATDDPVAAARGPLGFNDGLRAGWEAVVALGRGLGLTAGALLPFSPVLAVAGYLLWRARSRRAPLAAPST
jgi:hypothetical protein